MNKTVIFVFFLSSFFYSDCDDGFVAEKYGVTYASTCEVCKYMTEELEGKLAESEKSPEILEMGYHLDRKKEKKEYKKSDLRLIEAMEETCPRLLEYNVHKERKDSTRFARGQSQTFSTLHGLVAKGVKVDLGIPHELWDKPSAEISDLKTKCENMMEKYEDDIEEWYLKRQGDSTLKEHLCRNIVLKQKDTQCLYELPQPPSSTEDNAKTEL